MEKNCQQRLFDTTKKDINGDGNGTSKLIWANSKSYKVVQRKICANIWIQEWKSEFNLGLWVYFSKYHNFQENRPSTRGENRKDKSLGLWYDIPTANKYQSKKSIKI